jgi:DNA-binding beta-propeller fold protein YncE
VPKGLEWLDSQNKIYATNSESNASNDKEISEIPAGINDPRSIGVDEVTNKIYSSQSVVFKQA